MSRIKVTGHLHAEGVALVEVVAITRRKLLPDRVTLRIIQGVGDSADVVLEVGDKVDLFLNMEVCP